MPSHADLDASQVHVVALAPQVDWYDRLCTQAGTLPSDDIVLGLPAGQARVLGSTEAVRAALLRSGAEILTDASRSALVGFAGALAEMPVITDQQVDDDQLVFHRFAPDDGSSLVVNGRVVATTTSTEPPVVLHDDAVAFADALADRHDRDLVRVLRYDDAVDDDPSWYLAADEILDVPFWTSSYCATIVRAAEATGAFAAQPDDPVPGQEVSLAAISPRLYAHLEHHVARHLMPIVREVWPYVDFNGLRDAFVIKYALDAQTELRVHHDVAQVSGSVLLNRGYEGGRLEFPRQGFTNEDALVGRALLWPSLVTHPHRSTPLTRGVKYALTMWFELPGVHVA
jgi:2OG-Fe(II) oxygenase superfamily